jgi:hypothetical protein
MSSEKTMVPPPKMKSTVVWPAAAAQPLQGDVRLARRGSSRLSVGSGLDGDHAPGRVVGRERVDRRLHGASTS